MSMLDMMSGARYTNNNQSLGLLGQLVQMCGGPQGVQNILKQFTGSDGHVNEDLIKQRLHQLNLTSSDINNLRGMCKAFGASDIDIDRIFNKYGLT